MIGWIWNYTGDLSHSHSNLNADISLLRELGGEEIPTNQLSKAWNFEPPIKGGSHKKPLLFVSWSLVTQVVNLSPAYDHTWQGRIPLPCCPCWGSAQGRGFGVSTHTARAALPHSSPRAFSQGCSSCSAPAWMDPEGCPDPLQHICTG